MISWFQSLCFFKRNELYRYVADLRFVVNRTKIACNIICGTGFIVSEQYNLKLDEDTGRWVSLPSSVNGAAAAAGGAAAGAGAGGAGLGGAFDTSGSGKSNGGGTGGAVQVELGLPIA